MKLALFLLIFGFFLVGIGIFAWASAGLSIWEASWGEGLGFEAGQVILLMKAAGLGLAVFGGGLAIGGIVRMIVKKQSD